MSVCRKCSEKVKSTGVIYCSVQCQLDFQHSEYIKSWKTGNARGDRGKVTKNISAHVKRYLFEKFTNGCSLCGWREINQKTGNVPLEIDHIDGNPDNNSEENLRLICPNCHSLTANFRNLNKGNGRSWRRIKYNKIP